jgi:hypothetical protein
VLEVDHVLAVVEGGGNDEMNLVTSCADCNRGKGRKRLEAIPRPDAEDAWLEIQQEVAELRRYQEGKAGRDAIRKAVVDGLAEMWCEQMGLDWYPQERTLEDWVSKFGPEMVEQAIRAVAPKVVSGRVAASTAAIAYTRGVLNKMAER